MNNPIILHAEQSDPWMDILNHVGEYDFYHLPSYHQLAQDLGQGTGVLIVYSDGNRQIALPLLLRPVSEVPGLGEFDWLDATSVYGYPGPIFTPGTENDPIFIQKFQTHLATILGDLHVVTVFSRTNPLLESHHLLAGLGEIVKLSDTVTIDLTIPLEMQFSHYRKSHRYDIRRARREGLKVYHDVAWSCYNDFVQLYLETMQRVAADAHYFFDSAYFDGLRATLGDRLHLFVAELDNVVCSAALFVHTNDIIQYHLSASADEYLRHAPSKLIIDEARKWGQSVGARWLHLGGGVGSQEDNLFRFKAGFSRIRQPFYIWKWVVQSDIYAQLIQERHRWYADDEKLATLNDYFPAYRI